MALLKKDEQEKIAALIQHIESQTDAELVTVLAKQSDSYNYIPLLWAAGLSLLVPLVALISPFWLEALDILILQWTVFVALALLLRLPFIKFRLIPKSVRLWRATNMARRQFLENNLHHTEGETGLLIFVSEAEHFVEILADRGINQLVEAGQWQAIVDEFIALIKTGDTRRGFETCLKRCGDILIEKVPATREYNELPNHLVVIE